MNERGCCCWGSNCRQDWYYYQREAKEWEPEKEHMQKDQQLIWVREKVDVAHSCNQSRHYYHKNQMENPPRQEVWGVLKPHHFHTFSGLSFFFFRKLWNHVVQGNEKSKHNEKWELLNELLSCQRINTLILWSFHGHVSDINGGYSYLLILAFSSNYSIRNHRVQS